MRVRAWVFALMLVALPGSVPAEEDAGAAALRARADAYWKQKVALDPGLLDFYVPVEKGGPEREQIPEFGSVQYRSSEVVALEVEGDQGQVETRNEVYFTANIRQPSERHRFVSLKQLWTRVDGEWYRVPPDPEDDILVRFERIRKAAEAAAEKPGEDEKK